MNELLGLSYSSVWWAFLYLMGFCLTGTVSDRLLGKLAGKITEKDAVRKAIHFVLDALVNAAVLFGLDLCMDSIGIAWWALTVLAVVMALVSVYGNDSQQKTDTDK